MDEVSKLKHDIIFTETLRSHSLTFHSTWGLFSPERIDDGTRMLIEELEVKPGDTALDLGCGYGPIGLTIAKLAPQGVVHMVDKDFVAIDYAKENARVNSVRNCEIYLSNGFAQVRNDLKFDLIASNLPAKVSNEFFEILFHDAKSHLKPGGKFYVVTISGLREYIKKSFQRIFGNYRKLKQGRTHTVSVAEKQ